MNGFLLDTNVVSDLRKPRPDPGVVAFVSSQQESDLFLSDVVFAEIRFGIEQLDDVERRTSITTWLDHNLRPLFVGRTLSITEDTLLRWRLKIEGGRKKGHTFGQPDLFVAVLAEESDMVAVTRDVTHFVAAGVATLNPWEGRFHAASGLDHVVDDLKAPDLLDRLTVLNRTRRRRSK
ncbi:type II toxin-antitoxin system VapC family toxin [Sphingobium sp. H39-3-25]|uniref:type II toxin-antitoxin system VapC family toxin n=1 Tax=Sphingomonadales TaxID=204457 RepID=UPI000A01E3E4|nr:MULTISPECIES: type II toxin-antitoxin system VapC family toxin [Sphingomonadaceae]MDF0491094.1 type II toxin-antitoxin system VapC family toxin [Sphingomonas pollutisoli]MDF0545175.1 type II toxin-antitoxin system VapC family toxin [Sphingobium arseniciresistens]